VWTLYHRSDPEPTPSEIERIYIRELTTGFGTTDALRKLLNPPKDASDRIFDFSQLTRLSVAMEETTDYERLKPLLEGAKRLQELTIKGTQTFYSLRLIQLTSLMDS
jgi:hypothetical protein